MPPTSDGVDVAVRRFKLALNLALLTATLYLIYTVPHQAGCEDESSCPASCHGRGTCHESVCKCDPGYFGVDCRTVECPNQCSHNGVCVAGVCVCKPRFVAPDCSVDRLDTELTKLLLGLDLDLNFKGKSACEFILAHNDVDPDGAGRISFFNDATKALEFFEVPTAMQDVLPHECPSKRYKTCALVGNSGTLRYAELGAQIDAHDMVYRFNQAPTEGFERHVGQRTTYESLNSKFANMIVQDDPSWRWRELETSYLFFEPIKLRDTYVTIRNKFSEVGAFLFSPEFFVRAHTIYDKLQANLEAAHVGCFSGEKPMSGFYATMFTLGVCDKVDMYGFDPWTDDMAAKYAAGNGSSAPRYHYFDAEEPRPGAHSFDATFYMYRLLELSGKHALQVHSIDVPAAVDVAGTQTRNTQT